MSDAYGWLKAPDEPIDLVKMDAMVTEMRAKKDDYDAAKAESTRVYKEYAAVEHKVLLALKAAGKKSYKVDGLGTISIVNKQVVTTPKGLDAKRQVFGWIEEKYGAEVLDDMRSINHMTLNSFYNEEAKKAESDAMFTIPGLEAPTIKEEARFRKG